MGSDTRDLHGAAGEKEYSDAMVLDPKVIALRDRVEAIIDPKLRDDEVHVRITLKDGRKLKKYVEHAIGSKEVPMTNEQLEAKFTGLVDDILGAEKAARLLALVWKIEELGDSSEICRAASVNRPRTSSLPA